MYVCIPLATCLSLHFKQQPHGGHTCVAGPGRGMRTVDFQTVDCLEIIVLFGEVKQARHKCGHESRAASSGAATPKYLIDAVASTGIRRSSWDPGGPPTTTERCVWRRTPPSSPPSSHVSLGRAGFHRDLLDDSCSHLLGAFLIRHWHAGDA